MTSAAGEDKIATADKEILLRELYLTGQGAPGCCASSITFEC
jgi:hypothetical protein